MGGTQKTSRKRNQKMLIFDQKILEVANFVQKIFDTFDVNFEVTFSKITNINFKTRRQRMVEQRVEKYEIHSYYKNQNESETKKIFNF